eukprot:Nitzschia sp. Nitz4//scaffold1_size375055//262898//263976//NITZ4_000303-RA/size375055-augustus-gene-0.722-mRNA-1//-1//CDS//3329541126//6875//frame0
MMRTNVIRSLVAKTTLAQQARAGVAVAATNHVANWANVARAPQRSFASFTMADVKELRAMSGAPIVDCKKALGENDGDLEKSMDWLRQHGSAKAAKKVSGRDADEGLVACSVSADGKSASLVKVASETDFAGKSQAFVDFVVHVADAALTSPTDGKIEAEDVAKLESSQKSVQTALEDAMVAIRENLGISSAVKMSSADGVFVSYVHGKANGDFDAGSSAAVVELVGPGVDASVIAEAGKKLAMHIVAAKPLFLDPESVPEELVEKERAVLQSQIADNKKPPEVQEKIINGRLRKFYEEICLLNQEHMVEEGNPKIAKAMKDLGLEVRRFEAIAI